MYMHIFFCIKLFAIASYRYSLYNFTCQLSAATEAGGIVAYFTGLAAAWWSVSVSSWLTRAVSCRWRGCIVVAGVLLLAGSRKRLIAMVYFNGSRGRDSNKLGKTPVTGLRSTL